MTTLFISYSRKDLEFAKKLTSSLTDIGLDAWVDWNDIPPTADWWETIENGIESSDAFLCILSPDSVASEVCNREIDHGFKNGKRMIPIIVRDVDKGKTRDDLKKLNWIFFREQDDFQASLKKLETGLKIDLAWLETHRKIQVRALEWKQQRINSLLLRGEELQHAETQLAAHAAADPAPTEIQQEFVLESRRITDRQRRIVTAISIAGLIAMAILTVFSVIQAANARESADIAQAEQRKAELAKDEAETQKQVAETLRGIAERAQVIAEEETSKALAGSLAGQANSLMTTDHGLALLLGIEAYERDTSSFLTRTNLFQLIQYAPNVRLFGFEGAISSVAISPDGTLIAIANAEQVSLLDAETKQRYMVLNLDVTPGEGSYVGTIQSVAFSPDGKMLATGGCSTQNCIGQGTINLWDVSNLEQRHLLDNISAHTKLVKTVVFSPDGKYLASGSFDQTINLYEITNTQKLNRVNSDPLSGHASFVNSLAFHPNGNILVSASDDKTIIIWDITNPSAPKQIGTPIKGHTRPINSIAFRPDGEQLASAADDNHVILWSFASGKLTLDKTLERHTGFVRSVAYSADGKTLASVGFDNSTILWDTDTGKPIGLPLLSHSKPINSVAFGNLSPDGSSKHLYWLTGSDDRTVTQWNLATYIEERNLVDAEEAEFPLQRVTSPDGSYTAEIIGQQIKLSTSQDLLTGHTGNINSISFGVINDQTLLASASDDQTVILWDVTNPKKTTKFLKLDGFNNPVTDIKFDGTKLVTIEKNGQAIAWEIAPTKWLTMACDSVKLINDANNTLLNEFLSYLPRATDPVETCVTNH